MNNVIVTFVRKINDVIIEELKPVLISFQEGAKGGDGAQGPRGIQGIPGIQGEQGVQGIPGIQGEQGVQGPQGIKGDTGNKGETGDQGIQGIQGDKGADGIIGVDGLPGVKGDKGDKGDAGERGVEGVNGTNGTSVPINVSIFKSGANGIVPMTSFSWITNLVVSQVILQDYATDISVTISGVTYNKTTLIGVALPSGTKMSGLDLILSAGHNEGSVIIIF